MAKEELNFTVSYDPVADIIVLRLAGFKGNTFTREHPKEEMVNIILDEETERPVGMMITEYTVFLCKYAPQPEKAQIRSKVRGMVPEMPFLQENYRKFTPAHA